MQQQLNTTTTKRIFNNEQYNTIVKWALNIYPNSLPIKNVSKENRDAANNYEKQWG